MSKKITQDEFLERVFNKYGDKITILSEYINTKSTIEILCNVCKYQWQDVARLFIEKTGGCPKCNTDKRKFNKPKATNLLKHEDMLCRLPQTITDNITILNYYQGSTNPIDVECKNCGNKWTTQPIHLYHNHGCIVCSRRADAKRRRQSHDDFVAVIDKIHYGKIKILSQYEGGANPIKAECLECGRIWDVAIACRLKIRGCAKCCFSKGELKIEEILRDNNIDFMTQVSFDGFQGQRDCGMKSTKYRYDFAIMGNGSIKHLIEYDGNQHFKPVPSWGGVERFKIQQEIDEKKTKYCQDNGIKLIRIPYTKLKTIDLNMLLDQ
jgi:very-short-patch-repair endonuclease